MEAAIVADRFGGNNRRVVRVVRIRNCAQGWRRASPKGYLTTGVLFSDSAERNVSSSCRCCATSSRGVLASH